MVGTQVSARDFFFAPPMTTAIPGIVIFLVMSLM